jgi:hypothetical protein
LTATVKASLRLCSFPRIPADSFRSTGWDEAGAVVQSMSFSGLNSHLIIHSGTSARASSGGLRAPR